MVSKNYISMTEIEYVCKFLKEDIHNLFVSIDLPYKLIFCKGAEMDPQIVFIYDADQIMDLNVIIPNDLNYVSKYNLNYIIGIVKQQEATGVKNGKKSYQ